MNNTKSTEIHYKNLAFAICLQAVRDYCKPTTSKAMRKVILKDLRSAWMDFITGGTSLTVADELEKNLDEITDRVRRQMAEEE